MGYGFPAAIAAALARPNRPSIALAGDGGFAMTMAELETAVRERARVVAIVFDNQRYGTIRAHQERRGKGAANTDLGPIDFAAAAEAFGARGVRVETDEQFEPALREALTHGGPSVLHLTLDRRWLAIDRVLEES
jgi:acetolactate synthase-1/2/3 large subunit